MFVFRASRFKVLSLKQAQYFGEYARRISNEADEPKDKLGDLAQLGERLPCTQEVRGSIPLVSTTFEWSVP